MNKFFNDTRYAISWGVLSLILLAVLGSAFLLTKTFSEIDKMEYPQGYPNTITIEGQGEAVSIPDVATFSFSVVESSESVSSAQKLASDVFNKIFDELKKSNIEEKDIKTLSYNVYPKYQWIQTECLSVFNCPGGRNELIGYEVNQTVKIKIRDTQKAGDILSSIGDLGVSNISGLNFEIDDKSKVENEARQKAIENANQKAMALSKDLGIKLGDVMSFSESNGPLYMDSAYPAYGFGGAESLSKASPVLPSGENTTIKTVYISYEIKR